MKRGEYPEAEVAPDLRKRLDPAVSRRADACCHFEPHIRTKYLARRFLGASHLRGLSLRAAAELGRFSAGFGCVLPVGRGVGHSRRGGAGVRGGEGTRL